MNSAMKKITPWELSGKIIDFLGTQKACRAFSTDKDKLSKYRSLEIDGNDNHRKSPFDKLQDIAAAVRIEIEDARNEDRKAEGRECLELIGTFSAQSCKGKFANEEISKKIIETFGGLSILFLLGVIS